MFGDAGAHARSAVSAAALPLGVAVEIKAFFRSNNARTRPCVFENTYRASCIARYAKGIYENCRAAITAAIEHGYAIEIDLQLSFDGRAMVFHDDTLDRLTDKRGDVSDYTAAELSRIKVGSGQDVIEPLEDILRLIDGRVIELKDQSRQLSQTDGRLEQATIDALSLYQNPVAVMSFNPHMIATMAKLRLIFRFDYRQLYGPQLGH